MKLFKKNLFKVLALLTAVTICFSVGCTKAPNSEGDFGGDNFGGGGTVIKPDGVDNSQAEDQIESSARKDLYELKSDTNGKNAQPLTSETVEITADGDYYLTGNYKSVTVSKSSIKAHLFLDNAAIENQSGKAISTEKKCQLTLTLIGENYITNKGDDVNAIHVKGDLRINGSGMLTVSGQSKNAVKVTKDFLLVDATLKISANNHAVNAQTIIAKDCSIDISSAKKDGLHTECDYDEPEDLSECVFTTDLGYVSLVNVNYKCNVLGDGIQADTFVYIDGGDYEITTVGEFVSDTSENRAAYGLSSDDFRYKLSGRIYEKVDSDYMGRVDLYALKQGCKGIKVGEIEFDADGDGEDDATITQNTNYSIMIKSGIFNIDSTDDAFHTNLGDLIIDGGTFTVTTTDDGFHADDLLKVNGGNITVLSSYEGLEGGYVEINGGTISVKATDDGINAACDDVTVKEHIIISGGNVTVDAGGDGLDSNGTILISGGTSVVYGPTNGGNAGLDADDGILVTGGKLFVTSALGMIETPGKNSTQYVISYSSKTKLEAEKTITFKNGENVLLEVELKKDCQSVIVSTPQFEKGGKYSMYCGDDLLETITLSNILTSAGDGQQNQRPMGPNNGHGGRPW